MSEREPPQVCVFCVVPRRMDREHLFAEWWRERFKVAMGGQGFATVNRVGGESRTYPSQPFNVQISLACKICNSGWMNRTEEAVRPLLLSMARDDIATRLTDEMQLALATWAVKTALVFEYHDLGNPVIPDSEYPTFYALKAPLRSHFVWLGRTDPALELDDPTQLRNTEHASKRAITAKVGFQRYSALGERIKVAMNQGAKMYATTMSIGYVVLQVVGTDLPGGFELVETIDFSDTLLPIWPIKDDVRWPPKKTIHNITGLPELNMRFEPFP
jgi:hypothetical protein